MTYSRSAVKDFAIANPLYVNATVTFYAVVNNEITTTKKVLYKSISGTDQAANPQVLDSYGKLKSPIYFDGPMVAVVSGLGNTPDHRTGIIEPPGVPNDLAEDIEVIVANIVDIEIIADDLDGEDTIGTVAGSIGSVNTCAENIDDIIAAAGGGGGGGGSGTDEVFGYTYNTANQEESLLHFDPTLGENYLTLRYSSQFEDPPYSQAVWEAYAKPATDGINNTKFTTGVGFILSGSFADYRLILGPEIDMSTVGIRLDGSTLGQVTRLERLIQAVTLENSVLKGAGTFIVDSQIDAADAFLLLENVRFEATATYSGVMWQVDGGNRVTDACRIELHAHGTPRGSWGIYGKSSRVAIVTLDASTDRVTDAAHGQSDGVLVRLENSSSTPGGTSTGTYYRLKNTTTNDYQLGDLATNNTVNITDAGGGTIRAYYGGRSIVTVDAATDTVTEVGHTRNDGDPVSFQSTGSIPGGLTTNQYCHVDNVSGDTYTLTNPLTGEAIDLTSAGSGVITVTGRELEWGNINNNVTAFRVFSDNTGNTTYNLHPSYTGLGVLLEGNTEKNPINIFANGCDRVLEEGTSGGTADSNIVNIFGQRCRRIYTSGPDNTNRVVLHTEGTQDLGQTITLSDGQVVPDPRVLISNGKSSWNDGFNRTHNGAVFFLIDRSGGSAADGTDSYHLTFRFTDNCYGILLWARRVQSLTGFLSIRNSHNGRYNSLDANSVTGRGSIPCPNVRYDQIYNHDLRVTILKSDAREAVRIGDATLNYYPRNVDFAEHVIVMDGYNPRTGLFPTTRTAYVIEKMEGGSFPCRVLHGNIELLAGCQNVRLEMPAHWAARYTATIDPAATATIVLKGKLRWDQVAFLPWLREGIDLIVEQITDKGGLRGVYSGGVWTIAGLPVDGVTGDFASISHDFNQKFKRKGLIGYDGTRLLVASGDAADDAWTYYDGSNANTVDWMAETTALEARMTTVPSDERLLVYDKLYYDLDKSGILAKLIGLYILGAHESDTALLNLISTDYDLVINGSPVFTEDSGFTGTGNTADFLDTGFDAVVDPEIMGLNDAHLGVFALLESSSGDMMGSANGRMKCRAATGGSSRIGVTTTSNPGWTTTQIVPRHVLGNRDGSGSHEGYDNGVQAVTSANGSNGLPDDLFILKSSAGATTGQVFAAHFGSGLTDDEISQLYVFLATAYNGIRGTTP